MTALKNNDGSLLANDYELLMIKFLSDEFSSLNFPNQIPNPIEGKTLLLKTIINSSKSNYNSFYGGL